MTVKKIRVWWMGAYSIIGFMLFVFCGLWSMIGVVLYCITYCWTFVCDPCSTQGQIGGSTVTWSHDFIPSCFVLLKILISSKLQRPKLVAFLYIINTIYFFFALRKLLLKPVISLACRGWSASLMRSCVSKKLVWGYTYLGKS